MQKDPDGSYDALGTTDGSPVAYDVSADLGTVTERTGGGGPGGPDSGSSTNPSDANQTSSTATASAV